jgi:Ulp1 family protease
MLMLPINKCNAHWSLCVVVNPECIISMQELLQHDNDDEDNFKDDFKEKEVCCILHLDSLGGKMEPHDAELIRKWLNYEWKRQKKVKNNVFTRTTIKVYEPKGKNNGTM